MKEKEWVEVRGKKNFWEAQTKPQAVKSVSARHARPEAVLIKPVVGMSYATILKALKIILSL